ncbi:hypothetical protein GCM10007190_06860 [Macrococcus hajekii]|uniref:DUF1129 family protein n=1 Tax=Macrococcus hajekii TaxID=198482 RepID=UPI00140A9B5F|nr:DUF1129 family protein [Macrococcus hajekii]GGB01412.1 hypothetical protein GCM10007190_06860 [Macrococcus hajekii]
MNEFNAMNLDYMRKTKYLNGSNKAAFMAVANYVRFSYTKSERDAHVILSDMLDHLIEAQENGTQTADFFGDDYQAFAQEITAELPDESRYKMLYHFLFILVLNLGSVTLAYGVGDLIKLLATGTHLRFPLISLIISCTVFVVTVSLLTFFMIITARNNTSKTLKTKLIIYLLVFLMLMVPLLFFIFFPIGSIMSFKYYYAIPSGIILFVLARYFYKKMSR